MSKAKLRAATVGGSADEIEAAFYEALRLGDIDKLMACWADEDDIVCVHPGGPRIIGANACASHRRLTHNRSFRLRGSLIASRSHLKSGFLQFLQGLRSFLQILFYYLLL